MLWVGLVIYLLVLLAPGRLFALHALGWQSPRVSLLNPATCLAAGAGLWVLWWLVLVPLLGAGTLVAMGVFALFMLGLGGAMYRTWQAFSQRAKAHDHFLLPLAFGTALLWPVLAVLPRVMPANPADYTFLTHLKYLVTLGGWPDAAEAAAFHITGLSSTPGWLALAVPLATLGGTLGGVGPLLSWVAVVALASALTLAVGIPFKWSNVLLASAAGLGIVLLAFPLPLGGLMGQESGILWLAMGLLCACLPLFSPLPLPLGIATLPAGLSLALAATLAPSGVFAGWLVALLWIVRMAAEGDWGKKAPKLAALVAVHILVLLPFIGAGVAVLVAWKANGTAVFGAQAVWDTLTGMWAVGPGEPHVKAARLGVETVCVVVAAAYGLLPLMHGLREGLTTHAGRVFPGLVLAAGLPAAHLLHQSDLYMPLLALVALLVAWRRGLLWYQATTLQKWTFAMPWRVGVLVALGVMLGVRGIPLPVHAASPYAEELGRMARNGDLAPGLPVVAWVETDQQAAEVPALQALLAGRVYLVGLRGSPATLGDLHQAARRLGADRIVVMAPSEHQRELLKLDADTAIALFTTTDKEVLLTAVFSKTPGGGRVGP